jgi:hypothetical protein
MHRPEGLLEIGRTGRLKDRVAQVVGRIRYANLESAQLRMWDEWILVTSDARYLRIREESGSYRLLLPFEPERPVPDGARENAPVGQNVPFEGRAAQVLARYRAKVLHIEGELAWRVSMGDTVTVLDLRTLDGAVAVVSAFDGVAYYTADELEDRAMWSIFGYSEILRAWDLLVAARERSAVLGGQFMVAASILLGGSLLGGLLMLAVVTAYQPMKDGWARFDFLSRDPPGEQVLGTVGLGPGLGFYTLSGECGLDAGSEGLEVLVEPPDGGAAFPIVRCLQGGVAAQVRPVEVSFRVDRGGPWRFTAVHRHREGMAGKAHVSWRLTWHMGSVWWPLYALLAMTGLGLVGLVAWPIATRLGVRKAEDQFEVHRAELALELRRRHAPAKAPPTDEEGL